MVFVRLRFVSNGSLIDFFGQEMGQNGPSPMYKLLQNYMLFLYGTTRGDSHSTILFVFFKLSYLCWALWDLRMCIGTTKWPPKWQRWSEKVKHIKCNKKLHFCSVWVASNCYIVHQPLYFRGMILKWTFESQGCVQLSTSCPFSAKTVPIYNYICT